MSHTHDAGHCDFQKRAEPLLSQAGGYAFSIVGNHTDAEDAVQESLLKAYRAFDGYDRCRPFKGWWFAIIRNCCLDLLQQRRSRHRTVLVDEAHQVAVRTAQSAETLREALAQLTPLLREILELRYFGGCSYQDMAESLEIPVGTVMSRLHAARQALSTIYRKE